MNIRNMEIEDIALITRAVLYAAEKHKYQRRKVGDIPYINHSINVANYLTTIGKVTNINAIIGAYLHDTIEDTDATGDEIEEHFGKQVRSIVEEVSDNKNLPVSERKRLQVSKKIDKIG